MPNQIKLTTQGENCSGYSGDPITDWSGSAMVKTGMLAVWSFIGMASEYKTIFGRFRSSLQMVFENQATWWLDTIWMLDYSSIQIPL